MTNSRQKGKRGELELAAKLRELFPHLEIRRSQQFSGKTDDSMDLVGIPGLSIECKRVQKLNLYDAMAQAREGNGVPSVFHRKNHHEWLLTIPLEQLFSFIEVINACQSTTTAESCSGTTGDKTTASQNSTDPSQLKEPNTG